jgi:cell division septal protein FtsQ
VGRSAELLERFEAADETRRDVRRSGRAARSPWRRLPEEESPGIRRSMAVSRALGLLVTVVGLILVVMWLVSVLTYTQPVR